MKPPLYVYQGSFCSNSPNRSLEFLAVFLAINSRAKTINDGSLYNRLCKSIRAVFKRTALVGPSSGRYIKAVLKRTALICFRVICKIFKTLKIFTAFYYKTVTDQTAVKSVSSISNTVHQSVIHHQDTRNISIYTKERVHANTPELTQLKTL